MVRSGEGFDYEEPEIFRRKTASGRSAVQGAEVEGLVERRNELSLFDVFQEEELIGLSLK